MVVDQDQSLQYMKLGSLRFQTLAPDVFRRWAGSWAMDGNMESEQYKIVLTLGNSQPIQALHRILTREITGQSQFEYLGSRPTPRAMPTIAPKFSGWDENQRGEHVHLGNTITNGNENSTKLMLLDNTVEKNDFSTTFVRPTRKQGPQWKRRIDGIRFQRVT